MLLRHCIGLWLCSVAVQGLGVYLMFVVKSHYSQANENSNLEENIYADLTRFPMPMVSGPFGTLFFPPSNVAPVDRKTEDSTPSQPPSLLTVLSGPVGLYIICAFLPLIVLCLVVLFIFFSGKEPARHLRIRPGLLEAGPIQYEELEPAVEPLRRRAFPCRTWG